MPRLVLVGWWVSNKVRPIAATFICHAFAEAIFCFTEIRMDKFSVLNPAIIGILKMYFFPELCIL